MTNELDRLNKELKQTSQEIDNLYNKIIGERKPIRLDFPTFKEVEKGYKALDIKFISKNGTRAVLRTIMTAKGVRYIEIVNFANNMDMYFREQFNEKNYKYACDLVSKTAYAVIA